MKVVSDVCYTNIQVEAFVVDDAICLLIFLVQNIVALPAYFCI
jgi:hypothetical protein